MKENYTLKTLMSKTATEYPEDTPNLINMLLTWVKYPDPFMRLATKRMRISAWQFDKLKPFLNKPDETDRKLLLRAIENTSKKNYPASCLFIELAKNPGHRVTMCLELAGVNIKGFKILAMQEKKASTIWHSEEMSILENLNHRAVFGEFDHIGFNPFVYELEQKLRSSNKSVMILGPSGVGKTCLVYNMVNRIVSGEARGLENIAVFKFHPKDIVASTKYRGEFENNVNDLIKGFFKMLKPCQEPVMYIPEMHTVMGAGACEGQLAMNVSNLLKPYLDGNDGKKLNIIGDTTIEEYNNHIAGDRAFSRRFVKLMVPEPDFQSTLDILKYKSGIMLKENQLKLKDIKLLEETIELADKHILNSKQPGKSVTLFDQAVALSKTSQSKCITKEHLLRALETETGTRFLFSMSQKNKLSKVAPLIRSRIFGQDETIDRVVGITCSKILGISNHTGCMAGFLFCGNTGVGKTQLAKELADGLYNSHQFLQVDMSEYRTEHSINKLLGSPPGYVDNSQGGILTAFLTTHNAGLILFDEIEKASSEVPKILLQILDEGKVCNSAGRYLSFQNFIVVCTTNVMVKSARQLGFNNNPGINPVDQMKAYFAPELLNRFDDILIFNEIDSKSYKRIIKAKLTEMRNNLERNNIRLDCTDKQLSDYIIRNQPAKQLVNARDVPRLIDELVIKKIIPLVLRAKKNEEIYVGMKYLIEKRQAMKC